MKNFFIKILTVFVCVLPLIIIASSVDDDKLRTQIRYQAESAGVVLTNVWTRVQSDRKMVIFGGTLGSTQELRTLFSSVTNYINFVREVQQFITTPDGNPYPPFFSVGFDPYVSSSSETNLSVKNESVEVEKTDRNIVTNETRFDPKAIFLQEGESEEGGG